MQFFKRLLFNLHTNSVDPDKTATYGAVLSGSTLFAEEASKVQQHNNVDSLRCSQQFFSHVRTGLPGLNRY